MSTAGAAARPGKVVSNLLRYNNCGAAATAEVMDRRAVRNPSVPSQFPTSSYPKRNPGCKNEREDEPMEGSNSVQPKPPYLARKVAAAQGVPGSHWY